MAVFCLTVPFYFPIGLAISHRYADCHEADLRHNVTLPQTQIEGDAGVESDTGIEV